MWQRPHLPHHLSLRSENRADPVARVGAPVTRLSPRVNGGVLDSESGSGVSVAAHLGWLWRPLQLSSMGWHGPSGWPIWGGKVDLIERSVKSGDGDQELSEALQRERESENVLSEKGLSNGIRKIG